MADNIQTNISASNNSFTKGMLKDPNESLLGEGVWTHARNAVNNSPEGQVGVLGNEQANKFCKYVPYKIIGALYIIEDQWLIFSTDDVDSEIGRFDESECSYTTIVNDQCLNFSTTNLIKGAMKYNFDCTWSAYWSDGLNPDRVLNIDRVPYIEKPRKSTSSNACYVPEYTDKLNCEALRLSPIISTPCLNLSKSKTGGTMPNGSYQVAIAYTVTGIRMTDYFLPSNAQSLFTHSDNGGALQLEIEDIDTAHYEEFELVLISYVKENFTARKVGIYSTRIKKILIDKLDPALVVVDLTKIPIRTPSYEKSDNMLELNGYLIRNGIYTKPDFNYQPQANKIITKWTAVEVAADYYIKGGNIVSYLRDEVYAFFIRWVYNTGEKSASYHIPGRAAQGSDLSGTSGKDALENQDSSGQIARRWQVNDTSSITSKEKVKLSDINGEVVMEGDMSYWESSELYPDNRPDIWGDLCGKPIRHHKMPDNGTCHIYNAKNNKIVVLGVKFEDITHPLDINGEPITSIVGYEILRASREGNKTIIAKGLLNNMAEYGIDENITSRKGLYQNYPFNDLNVDPFLSLTEVKGGCYSKGYKAMGTFKQDLFSFHSPDTQFKDPFLDPYEVKIHGEVYGNVEGKFTPAYQHPKVKLLRDIAVFCAAVVGTGVGLLAIKGKSTTGTIEDPKRKLNSGVFGEIAGLAGGTIQDNGQGSIAAGTMDTSQTTEGMIPTENKTLAAAQGIFLFTYFMGQGMAEALKVIRFMSPSSQYAYQYNAHGFYNNYIKPTKENIRRKVVDAQYVNPYLQDFGLDYRINNLFRSRYVILKTNSSLNNPTTKDDSRVTIGGLSQWSNPSKEFKRTTSAHYASLKIKMDSQYGQLDGLMQVPVSSCSYPTLPTKSTFKYISPVLFGGDVYINRYTEKNMFPFFNDWLLGQPDGFEYNYMEHVNIPYPKYWMDSREYDSSRLIAPLAKVALGIFGGSALGKFVGGLFKTTKTVGGSVITTTLASLGSTIGAIVGGLAMGAISLTDWKNKVLPNDNFSLDRLRSECIGVKSFFESGKLGFTVKEGYFYLFANGVRDFFVESEINLAQRDWGEEIAERHYDQYTYTDLQTLFRSDIIKSGNYYKYDYSLSATRMLYNYTSWGTMTTRDFNPQVSASCYSYYPYRAIYSLPTQLELKKDNWKMFLANNYFDFERQVTAIKSINQSGAMVFYETATPTFFAGVDQLQTTNGVKVTIGDGGLFGTPQQTTSNAELVYEYGSCQSVYGIINTPGGLYWVSQDQGKVFQYGGQGGLKEISRNGMKWWFAKYLPSQLLKQFPAFELKDNIASGVACALTYDNTNDILYVCKKDYKVKDAYIDVITYDSGNKFKIGNALIYLGDKNYFDDASFTISYDVKSGVWVSFHDWHPDFVLSSKRHFMTVKDTGIWKHNDRCDLFCNFYGSNYPFEIEYVSSTGQEVATLKNVEYQLESYKYDASCQDKNHLLDWNFDRAIIYNSEQISGDLRLVLRPKNDPISILDFPYVNGQHIDVLYSKEENRFRFNQFWDITRNRGEYSENYQMMWETAANGYDRTINPTYVNYQKTPLQHKKIRHYLNKILLKRIQSDDVKMFFRLSSIKITKSFR